MGEKLPRRRDNQTCPVFPEDQKRGEMKTGPGKKGEAKAAPSDGMSVFPVTREGRPSPGRKEARGTVRGWREGGMGARTERETISC